ncbi:MAG TPA: helix-hairpin-helix domain-containing protein [Prolixibacteraceae bacterium]|nr:helix-hairpin-helix domain-containing protein [Prolixibacteraceae bacterium]
MIKKLALLILIFAVVPCANAQEPEVQQTIEDLLESAGEELSDDADIQEVLDDFERFRQNPLNINLATGKEFSRLHLLSEPQINNLIRFREKSGTIFSLYEMASIDGFTPDVLQKIEPFISFEIQEKHSGKKKSTGYLFLRSTRTFSAANQSDQSKYEGSPERYYLRLKQTSANLEYGLTAEKDPGEAFFNRSNKYVPDYTSAFVNFRIGQHGSRIFAGDYHVRFGQGLVVWQGFSMGKSADATQVFRSNQGIRSYSSTDENQFFRGLAGQINYRHFTFSPFISLHPLDASVDTLDGTPYFGAFQTSGYHRTKSEISGENSLNQLSGGAHLSYSYDRWSFGFTTVYTRFDVKMDRSDEPYNQFLPEGQESMVGGFDWKGSIRKVFFFGEAAISANSGKALLLGVMTKPASNAELSLVYRNINKTYFSFYSNAFTESSRINDEHALYLGLKLFPAPHWILWAYGDFFRFKWIKYTTAAPSAGTEFLAQLSYSPSQETNLYLRLFQEDKAQRVILENLNYNEQQLINRIRFHFTQKLNEQISLKSRLEFSFYSKLSSEKGFLVYQDVGFKPLKKSFALNGRLAYFKTEGYNSRLYAYENDLLYTFSVPALYGKGIRSYLNFQHKLGSHFTLWLKLAATHRFAETDSELTVDSSTKSEIKIQLRYQF